MLEISNYSLKETLLKSDFLSLYEKKKKYLNFFKSKEIKRKWNKHYQDPKAKTTIQNQNQIASQCKLSLLNIQNTKKAPKHIYKKWNKYFYDSKAKHTKIQNHKKNNK